MVSYKSEKPRGTIYFFKWVLIYLFMFSLPFIYVRVYEPYNTIGLSMYILLVIIFLAKRWIETADITRISEIHFDTDAREIIFYRVKIFSKKQKRVFSVDDLRLQVQSYTPGIPASRQALTLTFRKKEKEVVEINTWKDGFSLGTIAGIWQTARATGLNLTVCYSMINGDGWADNEELK